ncbi:hypothetical protein VNO77_39005 [Canavalia gladiata]|uniref:Histidine kinase/HSP90-like ATPase domain-containing protein n=1 Tax=Canavalia gladiata TaxID=3824 RepID=A0AAN9PZB9_CANGL
MFINPVKIHSNIHRVELDDIRLKHVMHTHNDNKKAISVYGMNVVIAVSCQSMKDLAITDGCCLYSRKEIFIRGLISNASDALDKLRFLSVIESSLLRDAGYLEIRIRSDPGNGTITITGTGIGMTKEELIDCLGTIAQSGTSKFLRALKENKDVGVDNSLMGQFGVGLCVAHRNRKSEGSGATGYRMRIGAQIRF